MEFINLQDWNPWWKSNNVPSALKKVKRKANEIQFKSLDIREIIILSGVRRSGKTTIMYQMVDSLLKKVDSEQIFYVNLDDEVLRNERLEDLLNLYRQKINPDKKAFVFLDEIQNIPEWQRFVKKHYDLQSKIKFIISGSSSSLLKGEYSALLTGRNLTFKISPLSFKEFLEFGNIRYEKTSTEDKNKIINQLEKYFEEGGFPEVFFKEKEMKKILLKQYFEDIMYKEIVFRHNINAKKITDLAIYLLTNSASLFTTRKLRNFTGLSIDSIRDYLSYLEDSFLIETTENFSYSLKETKHVQKPKKAYCIDNGMRNIVGFRFLKEEGKLAENTVFLELKRREKEPYYWKERGEVDFVIKEKNNSLTAINVTYTNEINERETKALKEFKKKFKKTKKLLLITKDLEKKENGIEYVPLWKWLLVKKMADKREKQ